MSHDVTITLHPVLAQVLRNTLKKRAGEIDSHLAKHGEALDGIEFQLTLEMQRQLNECLAIVDAALPQKERA